MKSGCLVMGLNSNQRRARNLMKACLILGILVIAALVVSGNQDDSRAGQPDPEVLRQINETGQRIKLMKTLLKASPNHHVASRELADAYMEMGALQAASDRPQDSSANYRLAIGQYKSYLGLSPNDEDGTIYLSLANLSAGDAGEAKRVIEGLSQARPGSQKTWYVLGWVYAKTGDNKNAATAWEKALSLDPESAIAAEIRNFLASLSQGLPEGHVPTGS